jgi:hypothetical protein
MVDMASETVTLRKGFVTPFYTWAGYVLGALLLVNAVAVLLVFPLPESLLPFVLFAAVAVLTYLRYTGVGVDIGLSGVKIRRTFRTINVPWEQATRFVVQPRGGNVGNLPSQTNWTSRVD